jgi:hypothetical protein
MKKIITMAAMGALAMTLASTARAEDRATARTETKVEKKDFDARVHDLNAAVQRNKTETDALHGVSVETGVPEEKVRTMHKNHPKVGPAGILVACTISDETKQDPGTYMKRFEDGKNWTSQARDNRVPLEKIDSRLDHLQGYIDKGGDDRRRRKS